MTEPAVSRRRALERRLLAAVLRGMLAGAVLAALVLAWRFARGPVVPEAPPSVRVARLPPGSAVWSAAPADARYLPDGVAAADAARLKLLLLRGPDGAVSAFYLPQQDGRAGVPVAASPATPGIPCEDLAPDFAAGDIACRQATPGFDFALRHRWTLHGRALTPGTPDLYRVAGQEAEGDWRLQALR